MDFSIGFTESGYIVTCLSLMTVACTYILSKRKS